MEHPEELRAAAGQPRAALTWFSAGIRAGLGNEAAGQAGGIHVQIALEAGCVVLCQKRVVLQPLVSSPKAEVAGVPEVR